MEKIISLCKRRGFIFPSSEIYGGFSSVYDYGPLGKEMKDNIKKMWWKEMTKDHENIFGLDAAILMSPLVWKASGHLTAGFADELVECKSCHKRFKIDETGQGKLSVCPECKGELTKARNFNLMMKTFVGPVEDSSNVAYLRPETTQGIYINFKNVVNSMRAKIPFGIAQVGKAFRNEITPKNFIYRTREFEQMEMEWFCHPKEASKFFDYWKEQRISWYCKMGIDKKNLRVTKFTKKDLPHYAIAGGDIEYKFPFGWGELEALHNRGDWDLSCHSKYSGKDLGCLDEKGKKYIPYVVETSAGIGRSILAFLCEAYKEVEGGRTETTKSVKKTEILLKLNKKISPIQIGILPLVKNKLNVVKKAKQVLKILKPHFSCQYDQSGSIGRRYRRGDEIGILYAITIDFDSLEDDSVTVRDRNTMKQERININKLKDYLEEKL